MEHGLGKIAVAENGSDFYSGSWLSEILIRKHDNFFTHSTRLFMNIPSNPFILILCYHQNLETNHAPSNIIQ